MGSREEKKGIRVQVNLFNHNDISITAYIKYPIQACKIAYEYLALTIYDLRYCTVNIYVMNAAAARQGWGYG